MTRGRFIGVVGPSGAGKDSLIDAARRHFGEHGPVRFVTRAITRSQDAGGEAHEALSEAEFQARAAGIPIDIEETLALGRSVLVNLSRSVIDDIRTRFPNRLILVVTASPDILAQRLSVRGRESAADIEARLRRAPPLFPHGPDVVTIQNNGSLADAEAAFIAALNQRESP